MKSFNIHILLSNFNKYHLELATARLIDHEPGRFVVEMQGRFTKSCSKQHFFEDIMYEFDEDVVDSLRIKDIKEIDEYTYQITYLYDVTVLEIKVTKT